MGNNSHHVEDTESCPYCNQSFPTPHIRLLHIGRKHPQSLTESEHEQFEEAKAVEAKELRILQLKSIIGLILLYFGFLFTYSIFT